MKVDKHILKRSPSFLSTILNLGHEQLSDLMSLVHGNIVKPLSINPVDLVSPLSSVIDWQPWLLPYRSPVTRRCHAGQHLHFSRLLRGSRFFWSIVLSLAANNWKFWSGSRLEKDKKRRNSKHVFMFGLSNPLHYEDDPCPHWLGWYWTYFLLCKWL